MKNFIISILVLVVGAALIKYYVEDKPDIRYTLSNKIPTSLYYDSLGTETIQQVEIKNNGEAIAYRIIININKNIDDYAVVKYANNDSIITSKKSGFQIIYPQLPPGGTILIYLKVSNQEINSNNLTIVHNKGSAIEALSTYDEFSYIDLISNGIYLFVIFMFARQAIILYYNDEYTTNAYEGILLKNKPIWLSSSRWKEIREKSIANIFNERYYLNIKDHLAYKLLKLTKKPQEIDEQEWNTIIEKSEKEISKEIYIELNKSPFVSEQILQLKRPILFDINNWQKIQDSISSAFVNRQFEQNTRLESLHALKTSLTMTKPDIVNTGDWDKLKLLYQKLYIYKVLYDKILYTSSSFTPQEEDLSPLDSIQRQAVEKNI